MPFIQYPDIPPYPGVPALVRPANAAIAASPVLAFGIGELQNVLANVYQQSPVWGIFDADGNQLGAPEGVNGILSAIFSLNVSTLSTFSFSYSKETRVADFPVEGGSFASFNKVQIPANPVVTLALDGTKADRSAFLSILDDACNSTELFDVVTPEITYTGYTIERISYDRNALRGATLLTVDVMLKEIRQVSAAFAQATSPINNPQNPAATPTVNNGQVQAATPDTSTLKSIANKLGISN